MNQAPLARTGHAISTPYNQYLAPPHHHEREPCFEGFNRSALALKYYPKKLHCTFSYVHIRERRNADTRKFCFGDAFPQRKSVYMRSDMRIESGPFTIFYQPGPMLVSPFSSCCRCMTYPHKRGSIIVLRMDEESREFIDVKTKDVLPLLRALDKYCGV